MAKKTNKTNGKTRPVKFKKNSIAISQLVNQVKALEDRVDALEATSDSILVVAEPTIASLAGELEISPKTLRQFMRDNFPRPASELYKPWGTLTDSMVAAAKERYQA